MKRGSIALARNLCYEIAGPTDEDDDMTGSGYGSVDIAEILSAEVERLRAAICQTLDANGHLADGEVCTLLALKVALRESGAPWAGDELHNCFLSQRKQASSTSHARSWHYVPKSDAAKHDGSMVVL